MGIIGRDRSKKAEKLPAKRSRVRKPLGPTKLADVARMANVSTATASRVLNSPNLVSEESRARVHAAIKELNWIPHGAAKALASLRTRTIGALIPTLSHQAISSMLEALQQRLGDAGYTLLLGRPDPVPERTVQQAMKMIEHGIECLVLMGEEQPRVLMQLLEQRNVFYVVAYTSGRLGLKNCIGHDNFIEMSRLVQHLLDLGHRDFGLLMRGYEGNDRIRQRVEAVHETLAKVGIAIRPQHKAIVPNWALGAGRAGMQQILLANPRPTAVVCVNDYLAAGALIEAKAEGLHVPRDISIVGFDDLELAAQLEPPLTTVRVPAPQIGEAIARFIIGRLDEGKAQLPPRFEASLMIRESTGAPPRG
jgi:LacI family transcriptional regulator